MNKSDKIFFKNINLDKINNWIVGFLIVSIFYFGKPITYFKLNYFGLYFYDVLFCFILIINSKKLYLEKEYRKMFILFYILSLIYIFTRLGEINLFSLKNSYMFLSFSWFILIYLISFKKRINFESIEKILLVYPFFSLLFLILVRQDTIGFLTFDLIGNDINLFSQKFNYLVAKTGLVASLIILRYSEKLNTKKINYIKISFILSLITCGIGVIHSRMGFLVSFIVVFISIYLKRNKLNFKLLFYFFVLAIILIFLIMPTIFNITENILIKGTGKEIKSLTISCSYSDYFLSQQYGQEFKNPYCDELRDTFINKKNIDLGRLYFRKFQPCTLLTSLVIFDVQCSPEMKENDKISQYSDSTLRTTEQNNLILRTTEQNTLIWRTNLWSQIFDNLALNPKSLIFGIGFNNSIPEFFNLDQKYYIIDSAHNSFLSAMAWCGVIGLFIFIILKKFAFNLIEKNPLYHWKILFMISYILLSFADSTFETPSNSILYWVVIATRSNYKNKV